MINQQIVQRNVQRFESLLSKVYRDSVIELINYIRTETDFYEAPASTQFHLACEGGYTAAQSKCIRLFVRKKNRVSSGIKLLRIQQTKV